MAEFTPSKKTAQDFNDGVKYINGQGNETGDALQAETINNLVESALYTQGQADSAKQTAQGALSQVNQVLADKTLLPDVQKNYYNLGAFDTYVSNGDGTGTITRRTGYDMLDGSQGGYIQNNDTLIIPKSYSPSGSTRLEFKQSVSDQIQDIRYSSLYIRLEKLGNATTVEQANAYLAMHPNNIQYLLTPELQYTEQVIENQPIHIANQEEEYYWHEEWKKGLNLYNYQAIQSPVFGNKLTVSEDLIIAKREGASFNYTISFKSNTRAIFTAFLNDASNGWWAYYMSWKYSDGTTERFTPNRDLYTSGTYSFTSSKGGIVGIVCTVNSDYTISNIMIVEGAHSYPYEPYYGSIIREKDLSGIQLFPENVNPALTIGGDWEDKGAVTTSDGTTFHAYRRLS